MTKNARQLPSRSEDKRTGLTVLDDTYTFDANGNVLSIVDAAQAGLTTRDMAYDGLDRLSVATSTAQWGVATYAYDPLDNLRVADQGARQYRYNYDALNRLTDIKSPAGALIHSFGYDASGNTTNKNAQAYVFDSANRMNQVTGVQTYRYDGQGRRVQTTDADTKTTFWIYSQSKQVMYTSEARRSQNLSYIYLGNTQVATRAVAWGTGTITVRYQHTDSLGSPVAETDASGNLVKRNAYAPYGEAFGATVIDGTGYTGHVMDRDTGLTYMQQRYYDPEIGRFTSIDPVSARERGDNFNRYSYARSNPYLFTDPDGRESPCFSNNNPTCGVSGENLANNLRDGADLLETLDANAQGIPAGQLEHIAAVPAIRIMRGLASEAQISRNAARGAASEARVLREMGLAKNTEAVMTAEGKAIPDALTRTVSVEIKDTIKVSLTRQVRIQSAAARAAGRKAILVTGDLTKVSRNATKAFDQIIRRPDLGPQK